MSEHLRPKRPIAVLPEVLKNQIAAGEVVERPASVVKELAENSLDAGADRIDVVLERGGQGYLSVQDNGYGIPGDQLVLAVTRHATSKLESVRDLFSVDSFGFRGEALASVASVSRLRLASRARDAAEAAFILVERGEVAEQGPDTLAFGTRVEVRDLFLGVPARLKFLKTEATEARKCREALFRLSLAHLRAGFSLASNGRQIFNLAPGETLKTRLAHFWPPSACEGLREFSHESEGRTVRGLAGSPGTAQSRADRMLFYVNGRPVRDRLLMSAVREAYKGRLLSKESPQIVLFLDLSPREVDVNVHPAKTEVRFVDEKGVFSLVRRGVLQALSPEPLFPESQAAGDAPLRPAEPGSEEDTGERQGELFDARAKYPSYAAYKAELAREERGFSVPEPGAGSLDTGSSGWKPRPVGTGGYEPGISDRSPDHVAEPPASAAAPAWSGSAFGPDRVPPPEGQALLEVLPGVEYLGQVAGTYLVLRLGRDTLALLDQHAAHERVLYARMRRDKSRGDSQPLALPLDFALHGSEAERLGEIRDELEAMGFRFLGDSEQGFRVAGIPPSLETGRAVEYLRATLGDRSKGLDELWISLSCKAAVKAGDPLAPDEALVLIREWLATPDREYCPHGRPAVLRFGADDLEKMFKRRG